MDNQEPAHPRHPALRAVSTVEIDELFFAPALVVTSLERDHHLLDAKRPNAFEAASRALKGSGGIDVVPAMFALFPRPEHTTASQWETYTRQLCQLSQAGGRDPSLWGQVFEMPTAAQRTTTFQRHRTQLNGAYHAMKGFLELRIKLTMPPSTQANTVYWLQFSLTGMWNGKQTNPEDAPPITLAIKTLP